MSTTKYSPFPPPATGDIDWANLGIQGREVNGHVISTWNASTGCWSSPTFVKNPMIEIHGLASGLNYGQQAYEALKAYRTPTDDSIVLFQPQKHAARFARSSAFIMIPPMAEDHFVRCVRMAVARNAKFVPPHASGGAVYIRPVAFGSGPQVPLIPSKEYTFCVYVQPFSAGVSQSSVSALAIEDFDRAATRGAGGYKVGGNYAPLYRVMGAARAKGFGLALHLDSKSQTFVEEFSSAGVLGVRLDANKKPTLVRPESPNILESITSDSCMDIAQSWGWGIETRPIPFEELGQFLEIMACGTAISLVPVKEVVRESTKQYFAYSSTSYWKKLVDGLASAQTKSGDLEFVWTDEVLAEHLEEN